LSYLNLLAFSTFSHRISVPNAPYLNLNLNFMDWKKEFKSWGWTLAAVAFLYFTGLMTPIMGGLQSMLLATGIIKPDIEQRDKDYGNFNYQGSLLDANGKRVDLESYRGKTVFVNLWATWCPPCRAEMPHIENLYQKLQAAGNVEFVMIALDKDFKKSLKYVEDKNFSFPVFHAAYGLNTAMQSESIPTTLVISPSGEVVFYQEGMSNFDTDSFRTFLEQL
jgi:thiol-disulfide isomerase/thioredoxin